MWKQIMTYLKILFQHLCGDTKEVYGELAASETPDASMSQGHVYSITITSVCLVQFVERILHHKQKREYKK
jgi:hypothetical protein